MIGFLIGLLAGGIVTVFWMAMFNASSAAEDEQELNK